MGKKLVITSTVFFLLLLIFGFVVLREPNRMEVFQDKQYAERIEQGAAVYAENCANCHGKHAKAERCFLNSGEEIGCAGRPLNTPILLCRDDGARLHEENWEGTTRDYILMLTTVGRPETGMPAFGEEFRYDKPSALRTEQIANVTDYILNFELNGMMATCGPPPTSVFKGELLVVSNLPLGDPIQGERHFHVTYGCSACHGDPAVEGSNAVGPWSGNFKNLDSRKDGYKTADYIFESILTPSAFISSECPAGPCTGPPSSMPNNFALRMNAQNMADILAYLGIDPQESSGIKVDYSQ